MLIRPISVPVTGPSVQDRNTGSNSGVSFNDVLRHTFNMLENLDKELVASQIDLVTGNARDMHTAVLAAEKASLALDLVIAVRNKAIEAYQEIMRMPL
ncbi:MAG: flagellar hook-basal body complex protein FliE [Bacillota bacterium]|jgi:flagellar hook-basal body complex protein FliE|nr:flagellar hook-basal body complex protein FliE [Candidatus Fermentithermobacillaceae bacterium]HOA71223.1 flagellar hook-basal body complex protein FliE [Bacillota bacterium]HOP70127.1 flagellar hook-basal body complex protein FliE [Bacillota bacterium]HPT35091.1 flagellar hook-basal body complex protein FliE [Bacillota bacterium]HPZ85812.1 flagellar hook-basal body complex protein FliE [Bacillota bacterium]